MTSSYSNVKESDARATVPVTAYDVAGAIIGSAIREGASKSQLKTIVWTLRRAEASLASLPAVPLSYGLVPIMVDTNIADRAVRVADELAEQHKKSSSTGVACSTGSHAYRAARKAGLESESIRRITRSSGKAKHDFRSVANAAELLAADKVELPLIVKKKGLALWNSRL